MQDVSKPKAVVAAERINSRVPGVNVTAHFGRIEDMPIEFYQEFTVIVLGLDSLEARRYMNSIACSLLGMQLSDSHTTIIHSAAAVGENAVCCRCQLGHLAHH